MSGLTVSTSKLIDTLTDALQTGDNYSGGGIHLGSHRGPWREEPGNVDLLALTSSTGYVVGHTWIPVDGRLEESVWPVESAATVLAICKGLLARRGKEHTVDIDLVRADPPADAKDGDHPGWVVTLSETPALFASDTAFEFHAHPGTKFPLRAVRMAILPAAELRLEPGEELTSVLTLWSAAVLAPLVAVAKRRKMQIQFYRSEFRRTQVVQIGDTWIGAAIPATPLPGEHGEQPSIEPVLGDLVGAE